VPYNKEFAIAAQNAATAAATLLSGTGAGIDTFESVRTAIFNGTVALGGAESVIEAFEAGPATVSAPEVVSSYVPPAPSQVASSGAGSVAFNGGKHQGKTIAQVHAEDASYIEWAADKMKNTFMQNKCREYLNSLQAA